MSDHTGRLTIDLVALAANWRSLREQLYHAECAAVVKADAYGLGVDAIAPVLQAAGCRTFFVADVDEGVALRRLLGDACRIFILQGCPKGAEGSLLAHQLIPVIVSAAMFERWANMAQMRSGAPCALKLNTGMNRLGVEQSDLNRLIEQPTLLRKARVHWLISHFACADTPDHPLNSLQLTRFSEARASLMQLLPELKTSMANSAGILLGPQAHFDLVRPGIALYGGIPTPAAARFLQPVVGLKLPVIQVRSIDAGQSVSYGADYVAPEPKVVAAVRGGYADGLLRSLCGRGKAWFNGYLPLLGRVSMDCCVFDITHLAPEQRPQEGDLVELLGASISIDDMAQDAGTISYEILTRLGKRFKRHYLN